jgi:hypothetical protein
MNLKKPLSIILGIVFLLTLAYGLGRYHAVTAIIPPFQVYFSPNGGCTDLKEIRAANPRTGYKKVATLLNMAGYKNRNGLKFGVSSMRVIFGITCDIGGDIIKVA